MKVTRVFSELISCLDLIYASVQSVGVFDIEGDDFRLDLTLEPFAQHTLTFLGPFNVRQWCANKWNENMDFLSCFDSYSLVEDIQVKLWWRFHGLCGDGE